MQQISYLIFLLTLALVACGPSAPAPKVISVAISPSTASISVGGTTQLSSNVAVENGAATSVTWTSSDPSKATVSNSGLVSGVAAGSATITATSTVDASKKAQATITIAALVPKVLAVTITPPTASIALGGTAQLTSDVVVENGASPNVSWTSSDPGKITVNNSGLVTGLAAGTAVITATSTADSGKKAEATITVTTATITGVTVDPINAELEVGQSLALSTAVSGTGNFDPNVNWSSSNSSRAVVGPDGVVTAIAGGDVTITASSVADSSKSAEVSLTVKAVPPLVIHVVVKPNLFNIKLGGNLQLSATVIGTGDFNPNVTWTSSDPSKATVDNTGLVQAIALGTLTITATAVGDPSKTGTASITVDNTGSSITGVIVDPTSAELEVGQTTEILAKVMGNGDFDDTVSWSSSDPTKASVNTEGTVTALAPGNVSITATSMADPSKKGTTTLTISEVPVTLTNVSITPASAAITVGATQQFSAQAQGTGNFNPALTWFSSNTTVATITAGGLVTGIATGTATITATSVGDPTKKATATVQVVNTLTFSNYPNLTTTINRPLPTGEAVIAGGAQPYSFTALTPLPPGVSLNPTTGAISGTPTTVGESDFTIKVTDGNGASQQATLHLKVNAAPTLSYVVIKAPTEGMPITSNNHSVTAAGGTTPYAFTIASGNLPSGLSLDPQFGTISGTSTAVGGHVATIKLTDAVGAVVTTNLTLAVVAKPTLSYTVNKALTVGIAVSDSNISLSTLGGVVTKTFSATGLPTGLSINPSTGVLSGIPTVFGSFNVTAKVIDFNGASATSNFTLVVNKAPILSYSGLISVSNLTPNGTVVATPSLSGGTAPFTYTRTQVSGPAFTTNFTLNSTTGLIAALNPPLDVGTYIQNITVTDANGATSIVQVKRIVFLSLN